MDPFYEEDLSYIHHVGFTEFADRVGDELLQIFREKHLHKGVVVDLGCGSGVWAQKLVDNGYTVLGVDASESMIELARKNAPEATFHVSSMHEIEFPPCIAVTAMGEGLNYSMNDHSPTASLSRLFNEVATSLQEGGLFAFDIIVRDEEKLMRYRSWSKGEDWAVLVDISEELNRHELIREITVFRKVKGCFRRSEERHKVRVLNRDEVTRLLEANGFKVSVSDSYGNYRLAPRRVVYFAEKD